LKRFFRIIFFPIKWLIIAAVCVEVLSFLIITASNYIVYGHAREGSRAVYDPYTLFLQSAGIRPTANNAVSLEADKKRTIWMFGGSTMRGATDHDDRTIPSLLAAHLNSESTGLRFRLVNFGVNSFNSLLETKYLQKLLAEGAEPPAMIVFYDGANDAKYFAEHQTPYGHHGYRRTKALIESYYRSWFGLLKPLNAAISSSFTKELYDKFNEFLVPLHAGSSEIAELADLTEKRYDYVNKIAACGGAGFVVFWQPMLWLEDCLVADSVREKEKNLLINVDKMATARQNLATPYLALAERLKDKPYFVNFRNVLCGRTVPMYQADGVHLTDEGRKEVALCMGKVLLERLGK